MLVADHSKENFDVMPDAQKALDTFLASRKLQNAIRVLAQHGIKSPEADARIVSYKENIVTLQRDLTAIGYVRLLSRVLDRSY